MARRTGLVNDPFDDELSEDEQKTIVQAAVASGSREAELDTSKVAPDPENPKGRLQPKPNLVAGIKEVGQDTAGMVQPLDRWIEQGGNAEELPKGTEYIIVFGHGRWAACSKLGRPFRAVVNTTIKDLTEHIVRQLQENLNRENLKPIEEALGFQRLAKRKLSQRQIATKLGIGQDHVNKRLKLLNLPEEAHLAVNNRSLPIEAALRLADIAKAGGERNAARVATVLQRIAVAAENAEANKDNGVDAEQSLINQQTAAKRVVATAYAEFVAETALADKRKELSKSGATIIDNPRDYFTDRPRQFSAYLLTNEETITAAGTAVAHVVSGDRIDWYTTQDPEPAEIPAPRTAGPSPSDAPTTPEAPLITGPVKSNAAKVVAAANNAAKMSEVQEAKAAEDAEAKRQAREEADREEHERRKAAEARAATCIRIATKAPSREALTDRLARRLLSEDPYEYADDARELARAWLQAANVIDSKAAATLFTDQAPTLDTKTAGRVAYIYDLALSEARASEGDGWDSIDAEYIQRLKDEAAYQTSEWEDNHYYNQPSPSAL